MQAQASQVNAKEDTVLLLLASDVETDLSQFGTDLTLSPEGETLSSFGAIEDDSARSALSGSNGRELYIRLPIDPGTDVDKVLIWHGDPTDFTVHTYCLQLDSAGNVTCRVADTAYGTKAITAPGLGDFSIHWSTRNNPDTTGAGNALISELLIYSHTDEIYEEPLQFTHPAATTSPLWSLYVGGFLLAGLWDADPRPVQECRIGRAWHTAPEFFGDWAAASIYARPLPPARPQNFPVVGPYSPEAGFGGESEWAGAANAGYAKRIAQTTVNATKFMPLVNEVYSDPATYRVIDDIINPQWQYRLDAISGSARGYLDLTKLRYVQIPNSLAAKAAKSVDEPYEGWLHANWPSLRIRVQLQSWVTSGMTVPIRIYCYAMSRPPTWGTSVEVNTEVPAFESTWTSADIEVDHTSSGLGEWLDLGTVGLLGVGVDSPPVWKDSVYLCLGWSVAPDGGEANEAAQRIKIRAWQVIPEWPEIHWEVKP